MRRNGWGIAAALFYFAAGQAFIPLLGIENDEALFASPILPPCSGMGEFTIFHAHFSLLLMSYLGTLKTLIYWPILRFFEGSEWTTREPMLAAGAVSIWLFYLLLRRIAGETAARIGALLLATDTLYLLTTCYDWGPVALQHLLLIAGMLLAVRSHQEKRGGLLAAACFMFGLQMWDKALAIWVLSGMAIAAAVVFPRQLLVRVRTRAAGIALLGFLAGALPLVIYNLPNHAATIHENVHLETRYIPMKARMLLGTADGGGLLDFFNETDAKTPHPHRPQNLVEWFWAGVARQAGHPRRSLFVYAFVLALLLAPLARGRGLRAMVFALVALAIGWAEMAITVNAGGSVHHSILVWPLPQIVVAVGLATAAERFRRARIAVAAVTALVCASSVAVTGEYYARIARNGGTPGWTDAVYSLNAYLGESSATAIYAMDWGFFDTLRLLSNGDLPLREGTGPVSEPSPNLTSVRGMISDSKHVFVTHPAALTFMHGPDENLARLAHDEGYERQNVALVEDSFGRTMFEVYRFRKAPASSPAETRSIP